MQSLMFGDNSMTGLNIGNGFQKTREKNIQFNLKERVL